MIIRTPDYRLHVFVSSTLKELTEERKAVRKAILELRLTPVMFESGARPHPAQELYKSYLSQSQIFIGIYWQSYGWIAPDMQISGLEDEYNLSASLPHLIYIKNPGPQREPALASLLERIRKDNSSCYTSFSTPQELKELVQNDLALLLTEHFEDIKRNEQAPSETRVHPSTNLPIPRNPLIGRTQELAATRNLFLRDDAALVTLTGTGGTGKSRLAIQIGLEMLENFKEGVYMVELESIRDPSIVISSIAEKLGIHETPGSRPIAEMLKEFLRDKQMLLLLDNFEQVVEAAPRIAKLLEACPRLKILVTSRIPLRLRPEKEFPVPPLAVPSLISNSLDDLSQYAAVELFIQRAQAVMPDFKLTNDNAPAVAEICQSLDGLPLAIELAAARVKLLTPQGLLARLEHRFDLLRGGTRDLPERQRTLRGAIDWSYNLLNEQERKLFRRLSIFIGGWTLEDAETVCDMDGDMAQRLDDALAELIDNNLVIQFQGTEEQARFGMLGTIHDYAFERLSESDEEDPVHCQHAQYYLNFVKKVEPLIRSAERVRWSRVMLHEFGNIRGVLEWISTTRKCIEIGQQLFLNVGVFWHLSGNIAEGRHWCTLLLALCDESTPITIRAGLLCYAGELAWAQGDHFSAVASLDKSLEFCRMLDDEHLSGFAMLVRGMVASTSRDLSTATAMLQGSIEIHKTIHDQWYKAIALSWLGDIALYENDLDRAISFYNQSIELARQQGDPWCMVPPLMSTAIIAVLDGNLTKARSTYQEAIGLLHQTGDRWSLSWALNDLGHVMLMQGDLDLAGSYFLEGLTTANALGHQRVLLISLAGTAALIARRSKNLPDAQQQEPAELALAARLCGATLPFIDTPGVFAWADSKMLYDAAIQQVQSLMDGELWARAYAEGQNMPFDQAVDLAIQALRE